MLSSEPFQSPLLERVPCVGEEKVIHIAAGAEHSSLVTGIISNQSHLLANCRLTFFVSSIIFLYFPLPFHRLVFSENGKIMTWGWGEHGQLGLGDTSDQTFPHVVNIGCSGHRSGSHIRVYCGSGFTLLVKQV